jgi:outer membrane protein assembly factor BamB
METMDVSLLNPEVLPEVQKLIIPTVMIPLTALTVALSMLASLIAGLFGIKLKTEGPRRLLEVLLKPRVLLGALALNLAVLGSIHGYDYVKNYPRFLFTIERRQAAEAKPSQREYGNHHSVRGEYSPSAIAVAKGIVAELQPVWKEKLPKGAFRSPLIAGESVFVGSMDGYVYELDVKSGQTLRKFYIGTPITPELTIDEGVLYVGEGVHDTHSARIYAFDLRSGKFKGAYQTKGHTEGQPVVGVHDNEKLIFAVAGSDGVHAIDPKTMQAKWTAHDGHIDASVRVHNGRVFAGTGREKGDTEKNRSYAVAYDFSSGAKLWKMELPASSWMNPVVWREFVCFVYGEVYFESGLGGVQCFRQDNGMPSKSFNLASPQTTLPLVIEDSIITTDSKGTVCSIDLLSQQTQWCHKVAFKKGMNFASPVYSPERDALVYASMSDGLYFLDRRTGNVLFNTQLKDMKTIYAPVSVSGLQFAVTDISGQVQFFR